MKVKIPLFLVALIGVSFGDPVSDKDSDAQQVMIISGLMWAATENYGGDIDLDVQDQYEEGSSKSYSKLVTSVESDVLKEDTIVSLENLFDVYETTNTESTELDEFIDKIFETPTMFILREYLFNQTVVDDDDDFKSEFKRIWFDSYEYADMNGNKTSGFNHVYMGEVDYSGVHGFHNWVRYYNEEEADRLAYEGWTDKTTVDGKMPLLSVRLQWNNAVKPVSTISFGTKPEYELAVFTLCFYKLPGDECYVTMGDAEANVVTEVAEVDGKEYVRTAYFTFLHSAGGSAVTQPDILVSVILSFFLLCKNFAL